MTDQPNINKLLTIAKKNGLQSIETNSKMVYYLDKSQKVYKIESNSFVHYKIEATNQRDNTYIDTTNESINASMDNISQESNNPLLEEEEYKNINDRGKTKKGIPAYQLFRIDILPQIKKTRPPKNKETINYNQLIKEAWKNLKTSEKQKYLDMARKYKNPT